MFVAREIHIAVGGQPVGYIKQLSGAKSYVLFGRCKSAVVPHYSAYVSETQKHIGLFAENHFSSPLGGSDCRSHARPASAYYYYFRHKNTFLS